MLGRGLLSGFGKHCPKFHQFDFETDSDCQFFLCDCQIVLDQSVSQENLQELKAHLCRVASGFREVPQIWPTTSDRSLCRYVLDVKVQPIICAHVMSS